MNGYPRGLARKRVRLIAGSVAVLASAAGTAQAQDQVANFYKGRTFTVVIGSSAGGGVDAYGRLIARHIGRFLPGNPNVVPQNMPGAGSVRAAGYIYSVAPKDGTQMAMVLAGAILNPLVSAGPRKYEPTKFSYVGNANYEWQVCVVRADAPVKSMADLFKTELIVGGTGPGSTITDYPLFLKNIVKAKIKFVGGYPGSREVALAIEKGELHGTCGLNWSSAIRLFRGVPSSKDYRVILQEATRSNPELDKAGVPLVMSFIKSEQDRRLANVFYGQGAFNRVYIAPPGVPADRLAAMRKAFMTMLTDKDVVAEATKLKLDLNATPGAEIEDIVAKLYSTPPETVARMKEALVNK